MKSKLVGLIALLAGSEAIGVLLGTWFFKLFEQTVPPAVLTNFNKATAKGAFLGYGVGAGALIFAWVVAAIAASKLFRGRSKAAST